MAEDEAPEINEDSKKDRESAEQTKALNAVTDNVRSGSGCLKRQRRRQEACLCSSCCCFVRC